MVHGVFDALASADHSQVPVRFQPLYGRYASSPRGTTYSRDRVEAGPGMEAPFVAVEMPANANCNPAVPRCQTGICAELPLPRFFEPLERHGLASRNRLWYHNQVPLVARSDCRPAGLFFARRANFKTL